MADPCKYIIDGNELTENQFKAYLLNEGIERFVDEGLLSEGDIGDFFEAGKNVESKKEKDGEKEPKEKEFVKPVIAGGEERLSGITHAATEETRKEFGLGEFYEKTVVKDAELRERAEAEIKKGYNIEKLISDIEQGKQPTDLENTILKIYKAGLEAKIEKNPSDENLADLRRLVKATDSIGSEVGRALRSRQGLEFRDDTLAGFFVREQDARGDIPLTEVQKGQVQKEYNDIQDAQKKLEDKIISLEKEVAKLKADKTLSKEKGTTKRTKKTHDDYIKERKEIINDIKEKLKQARTGQSGLTAVPIPYAKELFAIAPDVLKLTRSLINEAVDNFRDIKLNEIVSDVYKTLKDSIDGLTEKDIHDIIAGEYNAKRPTKNEISKRLFELREQAKLINRLEKLQQGVEPKVEREKVKRNQELEELRRQIGESEVTKLSEVKKRTRDQISKLENDLQTGNFDKEQQKEPLKLDKEALQLKDKLIKLRQEREARLIKLEYERKSKREKAIDGAINVLNLPRSLQSSIDFSAPLRQGLLASVAHPTIAFKAGIEMFQKAFSQKSFDRWFYDLQETPRYRLMEESGLYVANPLDPRLAAREETFLSNLAEKIPFIGRAIKIPGINKRVGGLVKGSERAYTFYLNKLRVDLFNRFTDAFEATEKENFTYDNNPKLYEGLASFINNATGRGNLGALESAAPILNSAFFSPRLIASRLNILGLSDVATFGKGFYGNLPKEVRRLALKDIGKFVGAGITLLALLKFAFPCNDENDKDCIDVEADPRSSDFGKIRSGNTRWDIWGGFQQYARLVAQLATGEKKSTVSGTIQELSDEKPLGQTRADVFFSFLRGKLAPVPSAAVDILKGRDVIGEKVTPQSEAIKLISPLTAKEIVEALNDEGVKSFFTIGVPSIFGVGTQRYVPRGFENVDLNDPTYKFIYDRNLNLSEPSRGDLGESQYNEFLPKQKEKVKEEWDNAINYGVFINEKGNPTVDEDAGVEIKQVNELSHDELSKLMKSISNRATRQAKKEIGSDEEN